MLARTYVPRHAWASMFLFHFFLTRGFGRSWTCGVYHTRASRRQHGVGQDAESAFQGWSVTFALQRDSMIINGYFLAIWDL